MFKIDEGFLMALQAVSTVTLVSWREPSTVSSREKPSVRVKAEVAARARAPCTTAPVQSSPWYQYQQCACQEASQRPGGLHPGPVGRGVVHNLQHTSPENRDKRTRNTLNAMQSSPARQTARERSSLSRWRVGRGSSASTTAVVTGGLVTKWLVGYLVRS